MKTEILAAAGAGDRNGRSGRWPRMRRVLMALAAAGAVWAAGPRLAAQPPSITISGPSILDQTESQVYTANVYDIFDPITWSVVPPTGLTLAPNGNKVTVTAGTTQGYFVLYAGADSVTASFPITVPAPPTTSISPTSATVAGIQPVTFTASVVNSTNPSYIWFTDDPNGQAVGSGGFGDGPTGVYEHFVNQPGGVFHVYVTNDDDVNEGLNPAVATVNVVVMMVTPNMVVATPGSAVEFAADVTGSQQAVEWSTNMPGGTVSSAGALQIPAGIAPGTYTVTAQTAGGPVAATGTAQVAVDSAMPVAGVAVSPARSVIDSGQQEPFTAVVEDVNAAPHPNQAVTWSVAGPAPAAIAANGLFTAPATPGVYTVTATSAADPTKSGNGTVTVGEDLILLPSSASLAPGASQTFTARVSGVINPAVAWSVEEGAGGGIVSSSGVYTAPATPGVYHVVAQATDAGGPVQGVVTITVSTAPAVSVSITPAEVPMAAGAMQQYTATVTGAADTTVAWSASAGTIDPTGLFTAPSTDGAVTITAASHADPQVQALATAVVTTAGGAAFQYDANGNVLSDGTRTYEWDAENRLTAINIGTQRSEFTYDGLGRRVQITEKLNGVAQTSRHYIWIGDQIAEETDATTAPGLGPVPLGGVNYIHCDQLVGWAWNPATPNAPIDVDIYDGSTKTATTLASAFRADVRAAGAGNGNHGFFFNTPASLKTGAAHTVTVTPSGSTFVLGTQTLTCAQASFSGSFGAANCNQIAGWAWDANQPDAPINVDIYDGTTPVAAVQANTFRQDLLNAGIGNGNHGFFFNTPVAFKTNTQHTVSLKIGGTSIPIGGTIDLTCPAPSFGGNLDAADCTQIAGWAWDANEPNDAIDVDIYDGTTLLATIAAGTFRQDLLNAGIGNGDHGFTYSTLSIYTGSAHSISVHYGGTATAIPGVDTITCPNENILTRFFPNGMQSGPSYYYFSYDHLGSVREVTNTSGTVVSRYDYDPWGRLTINQGTPPRFGFAGQYYHSPSGLNLTKYRAYDPNLGRWESRDGAATAGSDLYAYSLNDPLNLFDPDGWTPHPPGPPSPLPPGYGPTTPEGQPQGVPQMPNGTWRWINNPQDKRGGKWKIPGTQLECSWHKEPKGPFNPGGRRAIGKDHWDLNDGNRSWKLDEVGNEVPDSEAHPAPTPQDAPLGIEPPDPFAPMLFPIISPCILLPFLPGCPLAPSTDGSSG